MRNLMRLTYAANKAQAWEDWEAIAQEAESRGKFGLVCGLEPGPNATTKQIDRAIGLVRSALEAHDPGWTYTLPSAQEKAK